MKNPILFFITLNKILVDKANETCVIKAKQTPKQFLGFLKNKGIEITENALEKILVVGNDGHTYVLPELTDEEKKELGINLKRYNRDLITLLISIEKNEVSEDKMRCAISKDYFFVPPLVMPSGHSINPSTYYEWSRKRGYATNIFTSAILNPSEPIVENHALFSLIKYLLCTEKNINKEYRGEMEQKKGALEKSISMLVRESIIDKNIVEANFQERKKIIDQALAAVTAKSKKYNAQHFFLCVAALLTIFNIIRGVWQKASTIYDILYFLIQALPLFVLERLNIFLKIEENARKFDSLLAECQELALNIVPVTEMHQFLDSLPPIDENNNKLQNTSEKLEVLDESKLEQNINKMIEQEIVDMSWKNDQKNTPVFSNSSQTSPLYFRQRSSAPTSTENFPSQLQYEPPHFS